MNVPVTPEGKLTFEDGISEPGEVCRNARGNGCDRGHQQLPAVEQSLQWIQPDAHPGLSFGARGADLFSKVLIANRGAIACRIIRTLDRLGVSSVAVYSEADRHSLHVAQAGEAVLLGPPPAAQSYLDIAEVLEAARRTGAEAIHPGYGFLSENAEFAEACERAGIVFIGPTPAQMRAFGLKHTAREIAQANGVTAAAGHGASGNARERLESAARKIGFPVMLKSTAGGGGIGMRLCRAASELVEAFASVERPSQASFNDSGIYLEKFVAARAAHRSADLRRRQGEVIALGERDCSAQRRNQKVIEETPAPGLPADVRSRLLDCAVRLGKAVNYRSAGTVEFVYDAETARFLFPGSEHAPAGGARRHRGSHRSRSGGMDGCEWRVAQALACATGPFSRRALHSGAPLRRRSRQEFPAERRPVDRSALSADDPRRNLGRARHRGHALLRSHAGEDHRSRR